MNLRRKTIEEKAAEAQQRADRQNQTDLIKSVTAGRNRDFFVSIEHNGLDRREGFTEAYRYGRFNTDLTVIPGPNSPLEEGFQIPARAEPPGIIIVAPSEIFELDRVVIHQETGDRTGVVSGVEKIAPGEPLKSYQFRDPCDRRRHTGRLLSTGHLRIAWTIEATPQGHRSAPNPSVTVLAVSANDPGNESKILHFEDELRAIQMAVESNAGTVEHAPAARIEDLVTKTSEHQPTVIYFAGHGNRGEIFLRTEQRSKDVDGPSLASFLDGRGVELVVLSCCLSDEVANEILPHVKAVVGTTDDVDDEQAKKFSETFFKVLFTGRSVGVAFKDATDVFQLNHKEHPFALKGDVDYLLPNFRMQPGHGPHVAGED